MSTENVAYAIIYVFFLVVLISIKTFIEKMMLAFDAPDWLAYPLVLIMELLLNIYTLGIYGWLNGTQARGIRPGFRRAFSKPEEHSEKE